MIIDKEKTIFVHIPKTAGTSINSYFPCERLKQPKKHASIKEIKDDFPLEYETYKKFAIVRNPYDRILSYFFYLKKHNNYYVRNINFKQWLNYLFKLKEKIHIGAKPQHYWVDSTVNILKFENLKKEINTFFEKEIKLLHINKSNHHNFLEYYDKESLNKVYNMFKKDFNKFNYNKI